MSSCVYTVAQVLDAIVNFGDLVERFNSAKTEDETLAAVRKIRRQTTINNVLSKMLSDKQVGNIIRISLDENEYYSR